MVFVPFGGAFGNSSDVVGANTFVDSLDIMLTSPPALEEDDHTGVGFNTFSLLGGGPGANIHVFNKSNELLVQVLGLPSDNVEGFREGSPINFAEGLKGNLLIIHGTRDDNCHYQGAEALANELIRHNKPFTMMAYPNRTHALREGVNTRLHLRGLMTRYLKTNLPPGPRGGGD